jgi:hypothetical protein
LSSLSLALIVVKRLDSLVVAADDLPVLKEAVANAVSQSKALGEERFQGQYRVNNYCRLFHLQGGLIAEGGQATILVGAGKDGSRGTSTAALPRTQRLNSCSSWRLCQRAATRWHKPLLVLEG